MRVSVLIAVVLSLAVAGWLVSGQLGGGEEEDEAPGSASASGTPAAAPPVRVRVERLHARPHDVVITVRGRTEASRRVEIRAETDGRLIEVAATRGDAVREGDLLARLAVEEREARLGEFRARLRQRRIHYEATAALAKKGLSSKEALAAAQADVDAAKAAVRQIELDIERTRLRAPFDGLLLDGHAEPGDYLKQGDRFARIIDLDPILLTGSVTERVVAWLHPGMKAAAASIDGRRLSGALRYIAPAADPAARTYRIEVEADNPGYRMRAGLTADISIEVATLAAHFVTPALLALADDGAIGLKTVDARNRVRFRAVEIIEDTPDGVWLAGLPPAVTVITVGQDFVVDGQEVEPVAAASSPGGAPVPAPAPIPPGRDEEDGRAPRDPGPEAETPAADPPPAPAVPSPSTAEIPPARAGTPQRVGAPPAHRVS